MQSEAKQQVRKRYLHIDQYRREYQIRGLAFLGLGVSGIRPSFRISKQNTTPPHKQPGAERLMVKIVLDDFSLK